MKWWKRPNLDTWNKGNMIHHKELRATRSGVCTSEWERGWGFLLLAMESRSKCLWKKQKSEMGLRGPRRGGLVWKLGAFSFFLGFGSLQGTVSWPNKKWGGLWTHRLTVWFVQSKRGWGCFLWKFFWFWAVGSNVGLPIPPISCFIICFTSWPHLDLSLLIQFV